MVGPQRLSHQRRRYFGIQTAPARRAGSAISSQFRLLRFEALEDRRMLAVGDLDPTFDGDGKLTTDFGGFGDIAQSVAIQADGKIVVAGRSNTQSFNYDFALTRYNTNGSLDTSFSGDGKLTTPIGTGDDFANDVAIQEDGKIVVVGLSSSDFALVRYNTDGSLDTSFSGDGKQTTGIGSFNDQAYGVVIQPDGKIVAAGIAVAVNNFDFAVARYNTDGSLDTSFSGDGKQTTPFGTSDDRGFGMAMQSDGKIVVAGRTDTATPNGTNTDFAVARYEGDSVPALVGDYDRNDSVDAADYVMWRKMSGATGIPAYSGADGSGNGSVGPEDYTVWQSHFGATGGAGSGASVEGGVGSGEEPPAESRAAALLPAATPVIVSASQPPALPGVRVALPFSAVLEASEWRSDVRASVLRTIPLAEPGADGLLRDDALLAWVSSQRPNGGVRDDAVGEWDGLSTENSIDDAIGSLETAFAGCCGLIAN